MKTTLTVASITAALALTFALPLFQSVAPALGSGVAFARGGHDDARDANHGHNRGVQGADDGVGHDANDGGGHDANNDHGGQKNGHH